MTDATLSNLPVFKYHPDPVSTGSFVRSEATCLACQSLRGWIYVGPTYCLTDIDEQLCPWCIADGTAHLKFGAEFVDPLAVGDFGKWQSVPKPVLDEVCYRTPSFNGWQQERWFTHCDDAAVFLGCFGKRELESMDRAAYEAIKLESGYSGEEWDFYFNRMDASYGPTAYLFRCRHCSTWGGYSDVG
jgi:hypothetical protein